MYLKRTRHANQGKGHANSFDRCDRRGFPNLPLMVALLAVALHSVVAYGSDVSGMTTHQAFQVVTNISSSPSEFITAMKTLDSVAGEASFWLKIAADERYDSFRRKRCVRHFFRHFVSVGMTLQEMESVMGKNVNWISYGRITKTYREQLSAGWAPEGLLKGQSGFSLPILSDAPNDYHIGEYHLAVCISFQENLELEDLVSELTGNAKSSAIGKAKIAACQAWDSDDQARRDPGSRSRIWPWD